MHNANNSEIATAILAAAIIGAHPDTEPAAAVRAQPWGRGPQISHLIKSRHPSAGTRFNAWRTVHGILCCAGISHENIK